MVVDLLLLKLIQVNVAAPDGYADGLGDLVPVSRADGRIAQVLDDLQPEKFPRHILVFMYS